MISTRCGVVRISYLDHYPMSMSEREFDENEKFYRSTAQGWVKCEDKPASARPEEHLVMLREKYADQIEPIGGRS